MRAAVVVLIVFLLSVAQSMVIYVVLPEEDISSDPSAYSQEVQKRFRNFGIMHHNFQKRFHASRTMPISLRFVS
jgi:hypothetical protein